MQHRLIVAGVVCLMAVSSVYAQSLQSDEQPSVQQQQATSTTQSTNDSAVGGVPATQSQYGAPRTQSPDCAFRPNCDIFFGQ